MELSPQNTPHLTTWTPPITGYTNLNFEAGVVVDNIARWGFILITMGVYFLLASSIIMDTLGLPSRKQEPVFMDLHVLARMESATSSFDSDYLDLFQMLRNKLMLDNSVSLFVRDIVSFV